MHRPLSTIVALPGLFAFVAQADATEAWRRYRRPGMTVEQAERAYYEATYVNGGVMYDNLKRREVEQAGRQARDQDYGQQYRAYEGERDLYRALLQIAPISLAARRKTATNMLPLWASDPTRLNAVQQAA